MIIRTSLIWWYGHGMQWVWQRAVVGRLTGAVEKFSLLTLAKTLFAPYKQTFTSRSSSSFDGILRFAIDGFISRIVGFIVRSILIIVGLVYAVFVLASGMAMIIIMPFIPVWIVVSIILMAWLG